MLGHEVAQEGPSPRLEVRSDPIKKCEFDGISFCLGSHGVSRRGEVGQDQKSHQHAAVPEQCRGWKRNEALPSMARQRRRDSSTHRLRASHFVRHAVMQIRAATVCSSDLIGSLLHLKVATVRLKS